MFTLSGPSGIDCWKFKNKNILFLRDYHMPVKRCTDIDLYECLLPIISSSKNLFEIYVEASQDVLSIYTHIDLVRFVHKITEQPIPNSRVIYTDLRRTGFDDYIWMDDFLKTHSNFISYPQILKKFLETGFPQAVELYSVYLDYGSKLLNTNPSLKKYVQDLYQQFHKSPHRVIKLGALIIDLHTFYLMMQTKNKNIIYYAGESHIEILNNFLTLVEADKLYSQDSEFKISFLNSGLKKSSEIPEGRCMLINFDLKKFFG